MDTLADLVASGRDRTGAAVASDRPAPYTYPEFSTNAWKSAHLLSQYGVRPGATVALVTGPKAPAPQHRPGRLGSTPEPLLGLLGGVALGATVDLAPAQPVDARAIVLPDAWLDRYELAPGCSPIAYGGPPEAAGVAHFERELWSENPVRPPDPVAPDDDAIAADGATATQGQVLEAATALAAEYDLGPGDRVALDAPLTTVGAIVAGVVAPLSAGATIALGPDPEDLAYAVGGDRADCPVVDPTDF